MGLKGADALGVAGTPEDAREQLQAIASMDAIDRPLLTIPNNAIGLAERTIEEIAPTSL